MNQISSKNVSDITRILEMNGSRGNTRRLRRWIIWSASALTAVLLVTRSLTGNGSEGVHFMTQPAVRGSLCVTVTATGNLEPTNQVDVGSELSGTVKYVDVDYNNHVKKGQVLARLDTSKLQAQVLQSKASLESARAKVLQARATVKEAKSELARFQHLRELSSNKGVSRHDLDSAEATFARAVADEANCKAEVSRTGATLEANETDLSKALIRSPINGIVLTRSVEPGQTVAAALSTPVLFTLAEDLTKMKLLVDVDEADVGKVQQEQEATFTVDAYPDRRFPARITQVRYGAKTKNSVVTYKAVLNVDNSDLSLRPGMTATAEITVEKIEEAILVPNAALRFALPVEEKNGDSQEGGIMSKLLPHPPPPPSKKGEDRNSAHKGQHVWTMRDAQPLAVPVTTGATDGIFTVIKQGAIESEMLLLVDTVRMKQ